MTIEPAMLILLTLSLIVAAIVVLWKPPKFQEWILLSGMLIIGEGGTQEVVRLTAMRYDGAILRIEPMEKSHATDERVSVLL